ncbi:hypothetical protein NDU88_009061 [Pleurodeles waltl]|uniref:Uncharacterized protein n=1 Tax=Pleurodeles waltl TaxID=8319 RepID=A0AAV7QRK2_PLEWA|nr:hypothetical protein NDU88_009061 [Pleurodeles waltl]
MADLLFNYPVLREYNPTYLKLHFPFGHFRRPTGVPSRAADRLHLQCTEAPRGRVGHRRTCTSLLGLGPGLGARSRGERSLGLRLGFLPCGAEAVGCWARLAVVLCRQPTRSKDAVDDWTLTSLIEGKVNGIGRSRGGLGRLAWLHVADAEAGDRGAWPKLEGGAATSETTYTVNVVRGSLPPGPKHLQEIGAMHAIKTNFSSATQAESRVDAGPRPPPGQGTQTCQGLHGNAAETLLPPGPSQISIFWNLITACRTR